MVPQQYCLRWKHHHSNVQSMFAQLLENERFCDVTLYCSPSFGTQVANNDTVDPHHIRGVSLRAHRVVLAACSELLGALLGAHEAQGEPVLVLDGAEPRHLRALLDYMYTGEMNVHHSQLASLLKTAEELRIKGLTDIRWNNKDEPPDCASGAVTATTNDRKPEPAHRPERTDRTDRTSESRDRPAPDRTETDPRTEESDAEVKDKVNGGPPPLIKLPTKEKLSPLKRETSDTESPSPKRQRLTSAVEHSEDDSSHTMKLDKEHEWRHGNLDISAERVLGWGECGERAERGEGSEGSHDEGDDEEEWADPPADIGSFLHTRLRVDGDNSADEESDESMMTGAVSRPPSANMIDLKPVPKSSGNTDPRFQDVVKLNDYLQHGRRPQFWEESYVKRVMEAVRLKELEMKQAAEILGVSYGTLYGRYRDVFGCINRPYRTARDFWQAKGPSEILERLQKGELSLEAASLALGVNPTNLAAYIADLNERDNEMNALDGDGKGIRSRTYSGGSNKRRPLNMPTPDKVTIKKSDDEMPASMPASMPPVMPPVMPMLPHPTPSGKWPSIRVASLDTLREAAGAAGGGAAAAGAPSPSQLMRTRPDLTIVAARRDRPDDT
ncbi:uncharacterized protein LOC121740370 [Aricia agestis]|uniref:uncharacterized protein LOC121740370 n=1 Tax=Aricia agestis TaxID=91739 RepID=UPI001C206E55|nr:uncharacterized protein LOC121740370 [Aricia agestis]XP_041988979.1 uncharacterized protein LOC121740370 [Aricia agestis]XP_041988980.1 uncharacterized protein LOC121740370 [Aricia agestis]